MRSFFRERFGYGKVIILFVVAVNAGLFIWWYYGQPTGFEEKLAKEGEVGRRLKPQVYSEEFEEPIDPARETERLTSILEQAEEIINFKVELPVWLPSGMKLRKIEAVGASRGKPETALGDVTIEYADTLGAMTVEYASGRQSLKVFQGRTELGEFKGGREIILTNGRKAWMLSQREPLLRALYWSDEKGLLFFVFWSSELSEDELIAIANSIE